MVYLGGETVGHVALDLRCLAQTVYDGLQHLVALELRRVYEVFEVLEDGIGYLKLSGGSYRGMRGGEAGGVV